MNAAIRRVWIDTQISETIHFQRSNSSQHTAHCLITAIEFPLKRDQKLLCHNCAQQVSEILVHFVFI